METVPYLDLRAQYRTLRTEVLSALEEICESTNFAQGPATLDFEAKFAAYCGVNHCVSLNSGTSALHLALRCLDIGPGDEVISVGMTFIATAWAISYVEATPVFVDIDPARRTMCPAKLEAAITPRTKAIIPIHLYGMPAGMDGINRRSTRATDNRRRGAGEHGIAASALANLDNLRVLVFIRARISVLMVKGALVKMTQPLRKARGATRTRTESERLDITTGWTAFQQQCSPSR